MKSSEDRNPTTTLAAGEVLLEPKDTLGPDPFTDASGSTVSGPSPTSSTASGTSNPSSPANGVPISPMSTASPSGIEVSASSAPSATGAPEAATARPSSPSGSGIPVLVGSNPGLYGGTRNDRACDREQMKTFLATNPDKAKAWTQTLNNDPTLVWSGGKRVRIDQINAYLDELTPVLLTSDVRVTNHGFANGRATARPSVLQAGTAVLVDTYGVPRSRCRCGNPLTRPVPIPERTTYVGNPWEGFAPTALTAVAPAREPIATFVLVDAGTGVRFARPAGSAGTDDRAELPSDIAAMGGVPATGPSDSETPSGEVPAVTATVTTAGDPPETAPAETVVSLPGTVPSRTATRSTVDSPGVTVLSGATFCDRIRYYVNNGEGASFQTMEEVFAFAQRAYAELAAIAPPDIAGDVKRIAAYVGQMTWQEATAGNDPPADIAAAESAIRSYAFAECDVTLD